MKKLQAIVLFILFSVPLKAQPPYMACFTVNTNRACAPANIVTNSSCFPGSTADVVYNYDYVANPFATGITTTTHTYTTPGTYVIKQEVNDGAGGGGTNSTFDTIEVLDGNAQPVYTVSLCAGRQAKVTVGTNYDQYEINFGDGPGSITTVALGGTYTYTYPTVTSRTITVTGRFISLCTGPASTKNIIPFDNLVTPDIIDLTVNTQATIGSVNIRYNATSERYYRTTYGTPAQYDTAFAPSSGIQTRTINNINTLSTIYTFRMQNIDMCGNASAFSASISNIIISPSALNGANQVSFTSNNTLGQTYDLYRNSTLLQATVTSPYADNSVLCGTDYCYRVQGNLPTTSVAAGTFHKSYSVTSCIKATYTGAAPVITNLNSTVEDNRVKVVWDQPSLNTAVPSVDYYTIYRNNNGSYNNYGSSNSNNYTDQGVNVNAEPYCYEISYKDACNNVSPISTNTCTVLLTVTRTDETNYLSWTPYTGYLSGIKEYIIENLDESGNVVISKSAGLSTSYSETADQTLSQIIYRIKVVPMGTENLVSLSNTVRIDLTPQVFMPTIFTPNGDGDNDLLEVKGKYYKSVKMTIMNKWGEVLFISEDAGKGWDGNYKGQPVSVDSYAYHVVAFDNQGKEISLKGVVSLLR